VIHFSWNIIMTQTFLLQDTVQLCHALHQLSGINPVECRLFTCIVYSLVTRNNYAMENKSKIYVFSFRQVYAYLYYWNSFGQKLEQLELILKRNI
jgi:hypothetical protein